MRHCVNDVRKGRQFLRRPMYRPAIPTAPKCGLWPHFGAGTQVISLGVQLEGDLGEIVVQGVEILPYIDLREKWESFFLNFHLVSTT